MKSATLPIAFALAALSALGPLGTDMYLGALPTMATDLGSTTASLQMTMMSFFSGFTIGQMFYGPISDRVGRKPVIFVALAIFLIGSIGCALAQTNEQLIALRFVQGLGGSIGMVICAAIIRDLYTGHEAAKLMSVVVMVMGLAPILAPLVGSLILQAASWRLIFAVLAGFSVLAAVLTIFVLKETRMKELRAQSKPSQAVSWYLRLLKSRAFIPYAGVLALSQGGFFAYIGGSSFVLMNIYGLSPLAYSIAFAANAIGLGIGSQISVRLLKRFGPRAIVKASVLINLAAAVGLVATQAMGLHHVAVVCALFFVLVASMGGIMPSTNTMAMEAHGAIAGTAAALMGALGFGAGALGMFLVGALADGTAMPLYETVAFASCLATLVAWTSFGERRALAVAGA
ncbi:DHA1 family bicyclomycin/chloramphenicol resistance-like MFS transporter [Rhizobium sp. SG_E_25_P2]|uniref:multidrug effflux MFS transporter n=1 Tax=Rhizobium sp. SG_E_25_P2 TaxID=2879942 RepID=UPI002473DEA9|nr:multidrug effflux MFS transporter [Rhizobium sp. SG_E_25_P2]MDH6269634.1 DHA1 family bicyclomycin/chloramphenicol resistance-like MFS transporter [Rhizobium sp. SG_E_25_P2]